MKSGFLCLALCAVSLFGCASGQFGRGDLIVVDEGSPNPTTLKAGDVILLRGHYTLASQPKARLMVSLTTRERGSRTRPSPKSVILVDAGSGSFELEYEIHDSGVLHVSFYPVPGGSAFGRLEIADVDIISAPFNSAARPPSGAPDLQIAKTDFPLELPAPTQTRAVATGPVEIAPARATEYELSHLKPSEITSPPDEAVQMPSFYVVADAFSVNYTMNPLGYVMSVVVTAVNPKSEGAREGLLVGDRLIQIDRRSVTEMRREEFLSAISDELSPSRPSITYRFTGVRKSKGTKTINWMFTFKGNVAEPNNAPEPSSQPPAAK